MQHHLPIQLLRSSLGVLSPWIQSLGEVDISQNIIIWCYFEFNLVEKLLWKALIAGSGLRPRVVNAAHRLAAQQSRVKGWAQ